MWSSSLHQLLQAAAAIEQTGQAAAVAAQVQQVQQTAGAAAQAPQQQPQAQPQPQAPQPPMMLQVDGTDDTSSEEEDEEEEYDEDDEEEKEKDAGEDWQVEEVCGLIESSAVNGCHLRNIVFFFCLYCLYVCFAGAAKQW